jgi:hypothetical protein
MNSSRFSSEGFYGPTIENSAFNVDVAMLMLHFVIIYATSSTSRVSNTVLRSLFKYTRTIEIKVMENSFDFIELFIFHNCHKVVLFSAWFKAPF